MENKFKIVAFVYLIENIVILTLCGFLCWYFKSFWGLIPLLFLNIKLTSKISEDNETDNKLL